MSDIDTEWHRHFYKEGRYGSVTWRGIQIVKHPMDLIVYAEVIYRTRPRVIIETGTYHGGSALFYADMMQLAGVPDPWVVTVDVGRDDRFYPHDPRIKYITGNSIAMETLDEVHVAAQHKAPRMVILDSDHSSVHVLREMMMYEYLVTPGSYLIVEDSNISGHPVESAAVEDGGPWDAIQAFLRERPEFKPDPECERFGVTFNPQGWLRRS